MTTAGPGCDPEEIALAAGLRYLPDDRPGIYRRRHGPGFSYRHQAGRHESGRHESGGDGSGRNGDPVSPAVRRRIAALAIPPAWTEVWIAPEPDAHLQATGVDDKGRKQYLYHPDWRAAADAAKFERLAAFGPHLVRLRSQVAAELAGRGPAWPCAAVVRLVDETLIRPGSRRSHRENGSVGATTLTAEHLSISRHLIRLEFAGKGLVDHEIEVRDPVLARRVSDLLDGTDDGEPIFTDSDGRTIDCTDLNAYIAEHAGGPFTAKDLRTWGATCLAADRLVADGGDDAEGAVRRAIEDTAAQLGNTVAVCRASYVAPAVLDAHRSGELIPVWRRSRRGTWLSRVEQTVRRVLSAG